MRKAHIMMLVACVASAASAASSDYYLHIEGVVERDGYMFLEVSSAGDLDGDALPDNAVIRLRCAGDKIQSSDFAVTPHEASAGQATGKRMHKPITFIREWGAATPQLAKIRPTYDVKTIKGARATGDGWTPITLSDTFDLCTEARRATKTRSNIQNN